MKSLALTLAFLFLFVSGIVVVNPVVANTVAPNSWVELAPMHQARAYLGATVVDGKIYAIGGTNASGIVGTNEEYNPVDNAWTFKASMPIPASGFGTAVYQGNIYCLGGNITEVYCPANDSWIIKTPMPTPRNYLQANVVNDKIYLIGGFNGSAVLSTVNEAYSPATDSWIKESNMPVAVYSYDSVSIGSKIYVVGSESLSSTSLNEIYDTLNDNWTIIGPNETPPAMGGAAGVTGGIYAPQRIYYVYNSLFYDPFTNTWKDFAAMPTNRLEIAVAVLNDRLYAIGGTVVNGTWSPYGETYTVTYLNNVEVYTPFGYGTVPPEISIDSPRSINYSSDELSLDFTTHKSLTWIAYSLDGRQNVTINGNTTLTGLSSGKHNITVYANDTLGNVGVSQTVTFDIKQLFPIVTVAVVSGILASVAVGVVLLLNFKKRKRLEQPKS